MSGQSKELQSDELEDEEITLEELRYWLEFGSWTTICLCPFLYYVNGPSVSPDQAVVRAGLVIVSFVGAIGLRSYKLLQKRTAVQESSADDQITN